MFSSSSHSVFELCKPVFYVTKAFGFFPFSVDFSKRDLTVKIRDFFQFLVLLVFWNFFLIFRFVAEPFISSFAEKAASAGIFIGFIILFVSIVVSFFNRKKLLRILKNLERFDQKVRSFRFQFTLICFIGFR